MPVGARHPDGVRHHLGCGGNADASQHLRHGLTDRRVVDEAVVLTGYLELKIDFGYPASASCFRASAGSKRIGGSAGP